MKVIGIDVGGTKITGISFESDKGVIHSMVVPTPRSRQRFLEAVRSVIKEYMDEEVHGIGIGLPGIVDRKTGQIINLPNLKFLNGLNILSYLRKFSDNVGVDNDLKASLRAEVAFGVAKNLKNAVMIAVGTGIGGALLINGEIYYGAGSAGEVGHMVINEGKTLEQLASGRALRNFSASEFVRIGKNLGLGLANVVNLFHPDAIILAGGTIEKSGARILPAARKVMVSHLVNPRAAKVKLLETKLKPYGGALGAAMLVLGE